MRHTPIRKPKTPVSLQVIHFKNLTSDTEVISPSIAREREDKLKMRSGGKTLRKIDSDGEMFLVELQDDTVEVEIPSGKCQRGHHVMFELTTVGTEEDLRFKSTSVVTEIEDLGDGRAQVTLEVKQFDSDNWEKIRNKLIEHQQFVQDLFNNLRQ